jgi:formiminoglutamate deiminase
VEIEIADGRIAAVAAAGAPSEGAEHLRGLVIPGLANAHSHAFQRALRGRTQAGSGSFWTWREQMYALAERLDPESMLRLARATFGEMVLAGMTVVGEFHYLHHRPGGGLYDDSNAMGGAIVEAAKEAGIRLTLLDACYLHGGIGADARGAQRRFSDGGAESWSRRVGELADGPAVRIGAAIHSVRAVDPDSARVVADWARERGAPLHAHVSEQRAENEDCIAAYGVTPAALLDRCGALSERFTAVHGTHLASDDLALLGSVGATCCMCPTTERDLADGIGDASALREAGARLALGSDSQAVIDLFEEARAVELDERLATGLRGRHRAADLLTAATKGGYSCLGWPDGGSLSPGAPADLVRVDLDGLRLAGTPAELVIEALVFAAGAGDVRDVMMGGEWVVRDGRHLFIDVAAELREALS